MKTWIVLSVILVSACSKRQPLYFNEQSESSIACTPETVEVEPNKLRRLTKREFARSLPILFGSSIASAISAQLSIVPAEPTDVGFDTQDNSVELIHVESMNTVAESIANLIVDQQPAFLSIGTCLGGTPATQRPCFQKFISALGYRLFRKPVDQATLDRYMSAYDAQAAEARADVAKLLISAMLQSPQFYYVLELDGQAVDGSEELLALSEFEIATRLALVYTGALPDITLLEEARLGRLASAEQIEAQARRLLESSLGRSHMQDYVVQYLRLDTLPRFSYSPEFLKGIRTDALDVAMKNEILSLMDHLIFETDAGFKELMTTNVSFVKDPQLAAIYGISMPAEPSGRTVLADSSRRGLLTRAALLASGNDATNPFHRGKLVLSNFFCSSAGRPDPETLPDAFATTPDEGTTSTRHRLETLTSSNVCMACHARINPLGFALEEFDSLGRYRTSETLINQKTGAETVFPIDARTTLTLNQNVHQINGAAGLSQVLAAGTIGADCFARKWYRFARGTKEHAGREACTIERLAKTSVSSEKGLKKMLIEFSRLPQFRLKSNSEGAK
ncbi:MAG TPA: DUF1592 domain-containing protein [Bdellovibrionales bacterium]|nr:DUF1592 domain-containing protein [Bdellovibrionales bacterium]